MSHNPRLVKKIHKFYKQRSKKFLFAIKKQIIWLLRTLFVPKRQRATVNAGFVLPTVVMVALVVVLLTTAILFRSFDRSKNASNVRVNEAVFNAAAPAIDRARAKLDALFSDPTLPRATPSDSALYNVLEKDKYRLGDETRLKLGYDIDGNGTISNPTSTTLLENDETLKSGWKFAVDTDNNGLKDSYTIYGIYFRNPTRDPTTGNFNRKRIPLETRIPPETSQPCGNTSGFSSLVGDSSWYHLASGNLGKSFFVYTFNVPITPTESIIIQQPGVYEAYKGNKSFAALEFQQDRSRVPLANNAAWFENDMEITPGVNLLLNGRVHTNGNLLAGGNGSTITLRQVSSIYSCFYNQQNGQIDVGGNVGTGNVSQNNDQNAVNVDLYQGFQKSITTDSISSTNRSTNSAGGSQIGFNDAAYNQRLATMNTSALGLCTNCSTATNGQTLKAAVAATSAYPTDVQNNVATLVQDTDDITTATTTLSNQIQIYQQDRTRRVPFAEISDPTGVGATTGFTNFTTSIDPSANWRNPLNSSNQFTSATNVSVTPSELNATYPDLQKQQGVQNKLGDRIFVGNNLPAQWILNGQYVGSQGQQLIYDSSNNAVNWTLPTSQPQQRWRNTQVQDLADLGVSDRNGFWEQQASQNPINPLDNAGGVRIITGAGIYVDGSGLLNPLTGPFYPRSTYSFLADPTTVLAAPTSGIVYVWPDTMPMTSSNTLETRKGDLLMRATAVYHYNIASGTNQTPIACVSSYYDPTNATTAKNNVNVDGGYGVDPINGRSNNGVVYDFPVNGRSTFFATNKALLQKQASLKFYNGLSVNPLLQNALTNVGSAITVPNTGLQLSDYSAIDTALCAISILNGAAPSASLTNKPPNSAIREASFLDGREVKQLGASTTSTSYDLDLEQRRPLEIRVTDIDLGKLASTTINSTNEYLLPYSGIIYASRDDSLLDASDLTSNTKLLSPTDFQLDPTRRPNGIRLIKGQTLARNPSVNNNSYNAREKGLILISNLPAYVKGQFNSHLTSTSPLTDITTQIEEFQEKEPSTNFYARSTLNNNFACRAGRNSCPTTGGDYWRPATVIADSMTLLSGNFVDGFRNYGDYDLNNNAGTPVVSTKSDLYTSTFVNNLDTITKSRLKNGFWENSFVTSASWWASGNVPNLSIVGSYTSNGVTPIQRRVQQGFPEYLMEVCYKLPVYTCGSGDWYVDPSNTVKASNVIGQSFSITTHKAGTTDQLAASAYQPYARRVAFKRDSSNNLVVDPTYKNYIPLGINTQGVITQYPYTSYSSSNSPRTTGNNTLWFRTTNSPSNPSNIGQATYAAGNPLFYFPPIDANNDGNPDLDGQPLLVPVLHIHDVANTPPNLRGNGTTQTQFKDQWLQQATNTAFNATFVVGNSPSRPVEDSAGLHNFVRFLENWNNLTAKISGSFIQVKRSAYATGPFAQILKNTAANASTTSNLSLFEYPFTTYATPNGSGTLPFYYPPTRSWGFDVALLSEQPDLFAQRFTVPPTGRPNEFFREVSRDDSWVQTLLCAGQASNQTGITTGTAITYSAAVPVEYRPSSCLSIPND